MDEKKDAPGATKYSLLVISAILHIATIMAVVFIYSQDDSIVNDYADKNHSHSHYSEDSHSHSEFAENYHSHSDYADDSHYHYDYADDSHSHSEYADDNHSHAADEIKYKSFGGFGKSGTIERAIRDLERK